MIENLTMEVVMSLLLFVLVNLLVVAALGAMLFFLRYVILDNPDSVEKLLRVAAFGAGLLTYVGAKSLGISIPELMASALAVAAPFSFGFLGVVFPALAGTFVAWFCLRLMQQDDNVAARGLVLFSAFFFAMFADTYASMATRAAASTSVDLILPNITFVLGVVLYTIFKYKPKFAEPRNPGRSLGDAIKERLPFGANRDREEESPETARQTSATVAHGDSQNNARNSRP